MAIKKITLIEDDDERAKNIQNEIKIFQKLADTLKMNKFLVAIEGVYQTPSNVYVIMEYCEDGDLE